VRLGLNAPLEPRVRSERNTIRVEFDETDSPAVRVLGSPADAAKAERGRATVLSGVTTDLVDGRLHVRLTGNGRLAPSTIEMAKDQPPRLFIDLPGVSTTAPAVTAVGKHDIQRIRVAVNNASPKVTRVVVDLARALPYRVARGGGQEHEFVIVFGEGTPAAPVNPASDTTSTRKADTPVAPGPPAAPAAVEPLPAAADPVAPPKPAAAAPASKPAAAAPTPATAPREKTPARAASQAAPAPAPATKKAPAVPAAKADPAPESPAPARTPAARPAPARPTAPAPSEPPPAAVPAPSQAPQAQAPSPAARAIAADQPAEKRFTGHPVSLDFQGVDLRAVLRTFAEITGLNIVIDPAVQGTVDVSLRDVPWDQALEIILRANQLGYGVEGNIVRIAPFRVLADEEAQRRKLAEEKALSGELKILTRTLSYARASQLAPLVTRTALSPRGTVQVDERTNTIIITDLDARLETATSLLTSLDGPEPQVEIEARIVQTNREFARAIGVQWGLNGRMTPELGNTTGVAFPNQGALSGRAGGVQGELGSSTAVNLGATAASSAIGLAMGAVNGAFNLDVALSALEKQGKGRILSTPRVSTQNNVEAEVTQGIQIPIQTVANNTVTVSFKDAALTLRVKPQITAANTVIMRIVLENASPDFSRSVNGIPPIDTQRANTEVLVSDGLTTVIGGIVVSRESTVNDRTPGLHRLPLLGWLFKRDATSDESRELLIFITPRIIRN
jgi:type IV pilus assembly protein PilQ